MVAISHDKLSDGRSRLRLRLRNGIMPGAVTNLTKICYKRNYLSQVIARIDFLSPLKEVQHRLPPNLVREFGKLFPIPEPLQVVEEEVTFSVKAVDRKRQQLTEWRFHDLKRENTLTVVPRTCLLVCSKYQSFDLLRQTLDAIFVVLFASFPEAQPSRLGLRYVNNINLSDGSDPTDWSDIVSHKLLGLFSFEEDKSKICRVFHNLELDYGSHSLTFQFGMHNPDFPAVIRRKLFVLDYDAHKAGTFDRADVIPSFDEFHSTIQSQFERSIERKLRDLLNGK